VAAASIRLLLDSPWQQQVRRIEQLLRNGLEPCRPLPAVQDVRVLGAIGVVELKQPVDIPRLQPRLVERGVWLRPFGRLLYTMPPYVIGEEDLRCVTETMVRACEEA
jgi:adenosylmethionine-8-amino-7-oxononanoate aminotransferase